MIIRIVEFPKDNHIPLVHSNDIKFIKLNTHLTTLDSNFFFSDIVLYFEFD